MSSDPPAVGHPGSPRSPLGGTLVVLFAASLFAWLGPLSKWAYDAGLTPLAFVVWRAGIGSLVLVGWALLAVRRGRPLVRPDRLDLTARRSLAAAVLAGLLVNIGIFAAFSRISVALALLTLYTYPALVAGTAVVLGRERMTRAKVLALGLASGGMVLVVAGGVDVGGLPIDLLGILFAFAASLSQVLFVTVSRDGYRQVPADQSIAWVLLGTAIGAAVISLLTSPLATLGQPFGDPSLAGLLLVAGILGAALPSVLLLGGIRWIGGTRTGILMLFEPVVGVTLAAWLLGEGVGPVQVAGGLAILGAALVIQRSPELPPPTQPGSAGPDGTEAELEPTRLAPVPGGP